MYVCMYVCVCVDVIYLYVSGFVCLCVVCVYVFKLCYQHDVTDIERTMYYEGCGIPIEFYNSYVPFLW